jgi:hypothetical protein
MGHVYWLAVEASGLETRRADPSYLPGFASNFALHPWEQKYQVRPARLMEAAAFCGNTFMPQTGSTSATTVSAKFFTYV